MKEIVVGIKEIQVGFENMRHGFLTEHEFNSTFRKLTRLINRINSKLELPFYHFDDAHKMNTHLNTDILDLWFRLKTPTATAPTEKPKTHHLILKLKSGALALCDRDEIAELSFYVYDIEKKQAISHIHRVKLKSNGLPCDSSQVEKLSTVFSSITSGQVHQSLVLFCNLVKICPINKKEEVDNSSFAISKSVKSFRSRITNIDSKASSAGQPVRKPFGSTFIKLSDIFTCDELYDPRLEEYSLTITNNMKTNETDFKRQEPDVLEYCTVKFRASVLVLNEDEKLGHLNYAVTTRTGVSNSIQPFPGTNALYVSIQEGVFHNCWKQGIRNVKVVCRVRNSEGKFLECISTGEPKQRMPWFESTVFIQTSAPLWNEVFRIDISIPELQCCHLYFTFHNCTSNDGPNQPLSSNEFAFAFFPLTKSQLTVMNDGVHSLTLYRSDSTLFDPQLYLNFPAGDQIFVPSHLSTSSLEALSAAAEAMAKQPALKDQFFIRTNLFSTMLTQDTAVTSLLYWKQTLYQKRGQLSQILEDITKVGEMEIANFLPELSLSCLEMFLISSQVNNQLSSTVDSQIFKVFETLVFILNVGSDKRFVNQMSQAVKIFDREPIELATARILNSQLLNLLTDTSNPQNTKCLRKAIKVWSLLIRFVTRARGEEQAQMMDLMFNHLSIFMNHSNSEHIVLCQILFLQQLNSMISEIEILYEPKVLLQKLDELFNRQISQQTVTLKYHRFMCLKSILNKNLLAGVKTDLEHMCIKYTLSVYSETIEDAKISSSDQSLLGATVSLFDCILGDYPVKFFEKEFFLWNDTIVLLCKLVINAKNSDLDTVGQVDALLLTILQKMEVARYIEIFCSVVATFGLQKSNSLLQLIACFETMITTTIFDAKYFILNIGMISIIYSYLLGIFNYLKSESLDHKWDEFKKTWSCYLNLILVFARFCDSCETFGFQSILIEEQLGIPKNKDLAQLLETSVDTAKHMFCGIKFLDCIPKSFITNLLYLAVGDCCEYRNISQNILCLMIKENFLLVGNLELIEIDLLYAFNIIFNEQQDIAEALDNIIINLDEKLVSLDIQYGKLLKSLKKFFKLLKCQKNASVVDLDEQISTSMKIIKFVKQIQHNSLLQMYISQIFNINITRNNNVEAGLSLLQLADSYEWNANNLLPGIDIAGYQSSQMEKARKEQMYLECIRLFIAGKSWERAILVAEKLLAVYKSSFNYDGLSETLAIQSTLFQNIAKEERIFPSYYRVCFYGRLFPNNLAGKQFVVKGKEWEPISSFCDNMKLLYPEASLITSNAPLSADIIDGESRYIQICAVNPNPDYRLWAKVLTESNNDGLFGLLDIDTTSDANSSPWWLYEPEIFGDSIEAQYILKIASDIPSSASMYYKHNEISSFTFSRPIRISNPKFANHPAREFLELHTEKTILYTEESFPCLGLKSRVKQMSILQIQPIENAIITIKAKTRQLIELENKYENYKQVSQKRSSFIQLRSSLGATLDDTRSNLNHNPFTMALKGAIDAPVNGGIPMYKSAFLENLDISMETGATTKQIAKLEETILDQIKTIHRCLEIHSQVVALDLKPLHEEMSNMFYKLYADELSKLGIKRQSNSLGGLVINSETLAVNKQTSNSLSSVKKLKNNAKIDRWNRISY